MQSVPYPGEMPQHLQTNRSPVTSVWARGVDGMQTLMGSVPPTGFVLLSIVSVQVGAALAKYLFTLINPLSATALRLCFAAILLLGVCRPQIRDRSRRDYILILLLGVTLACMNLVFYEAISRIPLGVAVAIEFLGPLGIAVLGSRRWLDLVWATLAGAGVFLLAPFGGSLDPVGVMLALLAAICWGAYIALASLTSRAFPGGSGLALAVTVGAVLLLPIGILQGGIALFNPSVLAIGAGVALIGTVIPYSLEFEALKNMPPRVFGVLMSVEPAIAALIGFVLLNEQLDFRSLCAIALVTAAAIGATLWGRGSAR